MLPKKQGSGRSNQGNYTDECLICFTKKQTKGNLFSLLWDEDPLCANCREKLIRKDAVIELEDLKCEILYLYNDAFSSYLLQYKELYDEALYPLFLAADSARLRKKYGNYTLVCPPSSEKKLAERGFHHVEKMFSVLALPIVMPFEKVDEYSQKTGGRKARKNVVSHIRRKQGVTLPDTPLLLVDDVLTTGSTLLSCYHLLQPFSKEIRALAVSGNKRWFDTENVQ